MSAPLAVSAREGTPRVEGDARAFVARLLARQVGRPTTLVVSVQAPLTEPDRLLRAMPAEASVLWHPPEGARFAGVGVTREIRPGNVGPFQPLRGRADDLFRRLEHHAYGEVRPALPRLFGGVAFAPGTGREEPWESFGDGAFVLPRWTYRRDGEKATLTLAIDGELLDAEGCERALAELDRLLAGLSDGVPAPADPPARTMGIDHGAPETFLAQVEAIRGAIAGGEVEKVVAARRSVVSLEPGADPLAVLARLRVQFPGCTRFAMWRRGAAFVGATPECLVTREGGRVVTEALAGSMARGHEAELLASQKDRHEHSLVVQAILEALRPFCREVEAPDAPGIRELPNVLHMHTPITGTLERGTHVLDLVQALHPTPAVGGVPTRAAIEWIARHEPAPRGWYSAPFGWLDARGDGSFVVALRSGVFRGARGWLFAGAGIMGDSDPATEYAETQLKMGALMGALAGEPA